MKNQKTLGDKYDLSTYLGYLQAIQSVMTADLTKLEAIELLICIEEERQAKDLPAFFAKFERHVKDSFAHLYDR